MKLDELPEHMVRVATQLHRRVAAGQVAFEQDGKQKGTVARRDDGPTRTRLWFTRDVSEDGSRCLHLATAPWPDGLVTLATVLPHSGAVVRMWLLAFFRDAAALAWCEAPRSPEGIAARMYHWRVFCDEAWNAIDIGEEGRARLAAAGQRPAPEVVGVMVEPTKREEPAA